MYLNYPTLVVMEQSCSIIKKIASAFSKKKNDENQCLIILVGATDFTNEIKYNLEYFFLSLDLFQSEIKHKIHSKIKIFKPMYLCTFFLYLINSWNIFFHFISSYFYFLMSPPQPLFFCVHLCHIILTNMKTFYSSWSWMFVFLLNNSDNTILTLKHQHLKNTKNVKIKHPK